jgi:nickel transport protein
VVQRATDPRRPAGGRARSRVLALAALLAALAAAPAPAHETLHEVDRGKAVAVRAHEPGGGALAFAAWEVYAPSDRNAPHQQGRTDRNGWLAFVPDAPGRWRVRVVEDGGHGLDVEIEAGPRPGPPAAGSPAAAGSSAAFVLRPLVGIAAIGAVFAGLFLLHRRKGGA